MASLWPNPGADRRWVQREECAGSVAGQAVELIPERRSRPARSDDRQSALDAAAEFLLREGCSLQLHHERFCSLANVEITLWGITENAELTPTS